MIKKRGQPSYLKHCYFKPSNSEDFKPQKLLNFPSVRLAKTCKKAKKCLKTRDKFKSNLRGNCKGRTTHRTRCFTKR